MSSFIKPIRHIGKKDKYWDNICAGEELPEDNVLF